MGRGFLSRAGSLVRLIRYRFLLFAGLLPFVLGQTIAWHETGRFDFSVFVSALLGLAFVLIAVESFNEYFDARMGTDRVFSLEREVVPRSVLVVGIVHLGLAAVVMFALALWRGWPVLLFASVGAVSACFYVMPPIKLAYRGLGELAILVSYGPMMTAGSFFLQVGRIAMESLVASVVPALLILGVAVINEVPDFYGDRLVGKRNITVRLGRQHAILLYGVASLLCFFVVLVSMLTGYLPRAALLALLPAPLAIRSFLVARRHFDDPVRFIPAIRGAILSYSLSVFALVIAYFVD